MLPFLVFSPFRGRLPPPSFSVVVFLWLRVGIGTLPPPRLPGRISPRRSGIFFESSPLLPPAEFSECEDLGFSPWLRDLARNAPFFSYLCPPSTDVWAFPFRIRLRRFSFHFSCVFFFLQFVLFQRRPPFPPKPSVYFFFPKISDDISVIRGVTLLRFL